MSRNDQVATPRPRRPRISHPRDFLRVAKRHATPGLLAAAIAIAISCFALVLMPRKYVSESKILLRLGREMVTLDPTAAMSDSRIAVNQSRLHQINSEVGILRSDDLLVGTVSELGRRHYGANDRAAADAIGKTLVVQPVEDSNLISVRYAHKSAEVAQKTLEKLLELYRDKHLDVHKTRGSREFFEKQKKVTAERIDQVRGELRELKRRLGIFSLEAKQNELVNRSTAISRAIEQADAEIASSAARLSEMNKSLVSLDAVLVLEESSGNPSAASDSLRSSLVQLRLRAHELKTKYREDSRILKDVRAQIKLATELLDGQEKSHTIVRKGLNANRERLKLDIVTATALVAGLRAKHANLLEQHEKIVAETAKLAKHEGTLVAKRDELAMLEQKRQRYLDSYEQTRIADAISSEKISSINMVQAPTLPSSVSGPPRIWILIAGLLLAIFAFCATVVFCDYFDDALLTPTDVEAGLGTRVLATLPKHHSLGLAGAKGGLSRVDDDLPREIANELEMLVTRILGDRSRPKMLAVTAARSGAGTTTTAFQLAKRLAKSGIGRVLLVDANASKPDLTDSLGIEGSNAVQRTELPGLYALPYRNGQTVRSLLADMDRCEELCECMVIDLPPLTEHPEVLEIVRRATDSILVVDPQNTKTEAARRSVEMLVGSGGKLTGAVLDRHEAWA